MYSLPSHYGTARFFASVNWAHWVTNQNGWLQSWLTHRLYSIKHRSAHKTKTFSQTLPTVELSPSSFPESEKETTQKINLVAERTVKDSGDAIGFRRFASPGTAGLLYRSLRSTSRILSTPCESENCFSGNIWLTGYFTFFLLHSSYSVSPCEVKTILIELDRLTGFVI